jgi:hypothetical protein
MGNGDVSINKHQNCAKLHNRLCHTPEQPLTQGQAKKPPLAQPPAPDAELNPGDRVVGLADFGKPTGEFGTVEKTNKDDALVKWDDDGRTRLHQPRLKKVSQLRSCACEASKYMDVRYSSDIGQ